MKKILAFLLMAMMLFSTCAFAEGQDTFNSVDKDISGELTLYLYYADSAIATIDETVRRMNEKYPNLKFNIEHRADSDGTALKTWAAVGELPDIFEIPSMDTYNTLRKNGDLYALDDAVKATKYYDLYINGHELYEVAHTDPDDGKQYTYGNDPTQVLTVFYNVSVLKELGLSEPKNYEDFKHCITVLKDAGKIPVALFGAEQWPAMAMYDLACVAEGAYEASNAVNDGKVKYGDDEAYFKAAKKLAELVEMGAFGTGALSTNASQAFELLTSGQAGFLVNGSWHWGTVEEEGNGDKVGWCHYNVFADADKAEETKTHCVGGTIKLNNLSVSSHPASGLDPETVARLGMEFSYLGACVGGEKGYRTMAIGDYHLKGSAGYIDFDKTYATFTTFTTLPQDMSDGQLVAALGNAIEMIISGNSTAEDFMAEMADSGY